MTAVLISSGQRLHGPHPHLDPGRIARLYPDTTQLPDFELDVQEFHTILICTQHKVTIHRLKVEYR